MRWILLLDVSAKNTSPLALHAGPRVLLNPSSEQFPILAGDGGLLLRTGGALDPASHAAAASRARRYAIASLPMIHIAGDVGAFNDAELIIVAGESLRKRLVHLLVEQVFQSPAAFSMSRVAVVKNARIGLASNLRTMVGNS